jgi:hypothetical protein
MRLTWDGEADLAKLGFKLDEDEGPIVTATLVALLDAAEVEHLFGEDLRKLVFDSRADAHTLSCDKWVPRAVFESHALSFAGLPPVACVPEFDHIEPAGAGHVRVFLKAPFALGDKLITVAVAVAFGGPIAVRFEPAQGALPLG